MQKSSTGLFASTKRQYVSLLPSRAYKHLTLVHQFNDYLPVIYPLASDLLAREMAPDVRVGLRDFFRRVGQSKGIIDQ